MCHVSFPLFLLCDFSRTIKFYENCISLFLVIDSWTFYMEAWHFSVYNLIKSWQHTFPNASLNCLFLLHHFRCTKYKTEEGLIGKWIEYLALFSVRIALTTLKLPLPNISRNGISPKGLIGFCSNPSPKIQVNVIFALTGHVSLHFLY